MEKFLTILRRIVAYLIDDFIMIPLVVIEQLCEQAGVARAFFYFWIPLGVVVPLAYKIVMHWRGGQTLGKMALGVQVVERTTRGAISLPRSIARSLPDIILGIAGIVISLVFFGADPQDANFATIVPIYVAIRVGWFFADFFMIFGNDEGRSLHDVIAGTVVVRHEKNSLLVEN